MKFISLLLLGALMLGCSEKETDLEKGLNAVTQAETTVIPVLSFQDADTKEVMDYIAKQITTKYPDFQFIISVSSSIPQQEISLQLRDIPASEALRFVSKLSDWRHSYDGPRLHISNDWRSVSDFTYAAFKFPKEVLFDAIPQEGEFIDAKPLLDKMGVRFPEGSQAVYRKSREVLIVKNTRDQIELIEVIIEKSRKR
jgi:hypothetical protein